MFEELNGLKIEKLIVQRYVHILVSRLDRRKENKNKITWSHAHQVYKNS